MDVVKYAVFVVIGMIAGGIMLNLGNSNPDAVASQGASQARLIADPSGFIGRCSRMFSDNDKKFTGGATLEQGCACILRQVKRRGYDDHGELNTSVDVLDTLLWAAGSTVRHQQVPTRLHKAVTSHGYSATGGQKIIDATLQSLGHCSKPGNI